MIAKNSNATARIFGLHYVTLEKKKNLLCHVKLGQFQEILANKARHFFRKFSKLAEN